jgi:hypothetical protein
MIDPTLRKGDNIVVNLASGNTQVLEIYDAHDGTGESVKKIHIGSRIFYGHIVRILRCGKDYISLEVRAPAISSRNLMFSDLKNCLIQKI